MCTENDTVFYSIIPFNKSHQESIDAFMKEVQEEFSEIFTAPDSRPVSELVAEQGSTFFVALHGKEVIGTAGLLPFDKTTAIIKRMFLAKKHRGPQVNISGKLLDAIISEAKKNNFSQLYLGTMSQFKAAQKFYSKKGFTEITKEDLPEGMVLSVLDTVFYRKQI